MNGRINNNLILQHRRSFRVTNWLLAHTQPYRPTRAVGWFGLFASPCCLGRFFFTWVSSAGLHNLRFVMEIIGYFPPPHLRMPFPFITMVLSPLVFPLCLPPFHSTETQMNVFAVYLYIWLKSDVRFSWLSLNISFISWNMKNTTLVSSQNFVYIYFKAWLKLIYTTFFCDAQERL